MGNGEIQLEYEHHASTPSDIHEYLPMLKELAEQCYHVTEFGVREVNSTWAFLYGLVCSNALVGKKLVSYDLYFHDNINLVRRYVTDTLVQFEFIQGNTADVIIDQTNLLFIDTEHTYQHLWKELTTHENKVTNWIAVHDTSGVYGAWEDWPYDHERRGELATHPEKYGMYAGVVDFVKEYPQWKILAHYTHGNGMTLLERI